MRETGNRNPFSVVWACLGAEVQQPAVQSVRCGGGPGRAGFGSIPCCNSQRGCLMLLENLRRLGLDGHEMQSQAKRAPFFRLRSKLQRRLLEQLKV